DSVTSDSRAAESEATFADPRNRLILTVVGLAQGLTYWLAYEYWPTAPSNQAPVVAVVFFVSVGAAVLHLGWTGNHEGRIFTLPVVIGLITAAVSYWVWAQIPGPNAQYFGDDARAMTWVAGSAIALYVVLPFAQIYQRIGRPVFPYQDLFLHSWNNVF